MFNLIRWINTIYAKKFDFKAPSEPYTPPAWLGDEEDTYLKYENFIIPFAQDAQEAISEDFITSLDEVIDEIVMLLPPCPHESLCIDTQDVFKGMVFGDMYGQPYECVRSKATAYNVHDVAMPKLGNWTDDTAMTMATYHAVQEIMQSGYIKSDAAKVFKDTYRAMARKYPYAGYGGHFYDWAILGIDDPHYMSCGDGSAMRSGIIGAITPGVRMCVLLSMISALPTHAHPEGIKGAVCTAVMTYYAAHGADKKLLKDIALIFYPHGARTIGQYNNDPEYAYFAPDLTLEEIIELYPRTLGVTCQIAVPLAISLFLLSDSYEDFIKHLTQLPMDADTVGAIAGGMMMAWWQISAKQVFENAIDHLELPNM